MNKNTDISEIKKSNENVDKIERQSKTNVNKKDDGPISQKQNFNCE